MTDALHLSTLPAVTLLSAYTQTILECVDEWDAYNDEAPKKYRAEIERRLTQIQPESGGAVTVSPDEADLIAGALRDMLRFKRKHTTESLDVLVALEALADRFGKVAHP